jgi:hypothetical protein
VIDHFAHLAVMARLDADLASTPGANPVEKARIDEILAGVAARTVRRPSARCWIM